MIRPITRPGIIVPHRGAQRPLWPYALNRDSAQAQGLVAWWPLAPGAEARDLAGPSSASLGAGNTWQSDSVGIVLDFPGNSACQIPAGSALNLLGDFSFAAWVRATASGQRTIYGGYDAAPPYSGRGVALVNGAVWYWSGIWVNSGVTINDGHWHQISLAASQSAVWFYLDGELRTTLGASSPSAYAGVRYLGLGDGGTYFFGQLFGCAVYNRLVSSAEVSQLYDPRTRWDLYYPLRQRVFFIPDSVVARPQSDLFSPLTGF